ncbi:hypothetical protein [Hufsiella ginkgonis]|uniref:Uncharacterized protein n=1 Tax=Hufsiella ginkgonis TaxID=2695274 RepID=A0A7K1Y3N1_9SPHI|nr:hypothetical protein [Hufsiella ginkgonis]MXV17477.1 hypothetical protein [Hufsiella ginkgonis]
MKATNNIRNSDGTRKFFIFNHELIAFIIGNALVLGFFMTVLAIVISLR